jgi:Protein of unknown function (DUF3072)
MRASGGDSAVNARSVYPAPKRSEAEDEAMTERNDPQVPSTEGLPGLEKDPEEWVTGDEPMTGAQASYLGTLGRRTGENVPDDLTKAEASEKIDEFRERAGINDGSDR